MEMSTRSENLDMKCKQTIYDTEKVSKQNAKKKKETAIRTYWTLLSLEQDFKRSRFNQQLPLSWKSFSSFKNMEFAGRRITNFEMHTKWAHYFEFTITRPWYFFLPWL